MDTGSNVEELDFDSVQRDNAEMQRCCQEVSVKQGNVKEVKEEVIVKQGNDREAGWEGVSVRQGDAMQLCTFAISYFLAPPCFCVDQVVAGGD